MSRQVAGLAPAVERTLAVVPDRAQPDDDPDVIYVRAAGELDIATAARLSLVLDAAVLRAGLVVLDLRDLAFIDSSGVHAIEDADSRARELGRRLIIRRSPAQVERLLALAGMSQSPEVGEADARSRAPGRGTGRRRAGLTNAPAAVSRRR